MAPGKRPKQTRPPKWSYVPGNNQPDLSGEIHEQKHEALDDWIVRLGVVIHELGFKPHNRDEVSRALESKSMLSEKDGIRSHLYRVFNGAKNDIKDKNPELLADEVEKRARHEVRGVVAKWRGDYSDARNTVTQLTELLEVLQGETSKTMKFNQLVNSNHRGVPELARGMDLANFAEKEGEIGDGFNPYAPGVNYLDQDVNMQWHIQDVVAHLDIAGAEVLIAPMIEEETRRAKFFGEVLDEAEKPLPEPDSFQPVLAASGVSFSDL